MNIKKTVLNEIIKWGSFDVSLFIINDQISLCYNKFFLGDYNDKKRSFNRLHYLKMIKHFIYLKIYNNNIKEISSNEKLLCYLKSILEDNGFDLSKWVKYF